MSMPWLRVKKALDAEVRQLLSAGVHDPWKFAAEIGRILRGHRPRLAVP